MSTTTRLVRPFPWAALDSMTKAEAAVLRDVRRWSAAHARLDAIEDAAARLLEARVDVLVRRAEFFRSDRPFDDGIGVLLTSAGDPAGRGMLIEAERALAASVVARALRRTVPRIVDAAPALSPAFAGAFAAVLAAIARRAHSGVVLRVGGAGPSAQMEAALANAESDLVQLTFTVLIEHEAFAARMVLSREACRAAAPPVFSASALRDLGATPLTMQVVACASRAKAAEVGSLRLGDAFVPDAWPLSRTPRGGLQGPAWLSAPDDDSGIRVELGEDGRVVLRGGVDALCGTEDAMAESEQDGDAPARAADDQRGDAPARAPDDERGDALVRAIGDVPVVVKVEIGEARMAARQWAALACGDVVALGRRLGDAVVLRVGGVAIARGELVDIDGEVGVRIAERLSGERTAP